VRLENNDHNPRFLLVMGQCQFFSTIPTLFRVYPNITILDTILDTCLLYLFYLTDVYLLVQVTSNDNNIDCTKSKSAY